MKFVKKRILIISPESWTDHHVSKHHFAKTLSERGNEVFFLNPTFGRSLEQITSNLFSINFKYHVRGLRWSLRLIQKHFISKDFVEIEKFIGVEIDIIWNFDPSRFYELSGIRRKVLKICHLVDLNQEFERKSLVRTSDICFCNTKPIYKRIIKFNENTYLINHGLPRYENQVKKEFKLPGTQAVKAIYAGNLDILYLDYALILKLIKKFEKKVDFIFLGDYLKSNPLANLNCANLFLMGKMSPSELPYFYEKADVLLITYLADKYEEQLANPHKILEYLLSGKTVIATKTLEYVGSHLIEMANTHDEYLNIFEMVLQNLNDFNSKAQRERRMGFAIDNTYEKQIQRIEEKLSQL